jgi:hypothetical protein
MSLLLNFNRKAHLGTFAFYLSTIFKNAMLKNFRHLSRVYRLAKKNAPKVLGFDNSMSIGSHCTKVHIESCKRHILEFKMSSLQFSSTSRAFTTLIRLLPVPAPRPALFPSRGFHVSQRYDRGRNAASNDTEHGTAGEQQVDGTAPTPKKRRRRLDEVCLEQYPEYSRNVIQSWIAQGIMRLYVVSYVALRQF